MDPRARAAAEEWLREQGIKYFGGHEFADLLAAYADHAVAQAVKERDEARDTLREATINWGKNFDEQAEEIARLRATIDAMDATHAEIVQAAVAAERGTWTTVRDGHPPRHARYVVRRDGCDFVGTPCYGMHMPWWVPMTPAGESEPIDMLPDDEWVALRAPGPRPPAS